MVPTDAAGKIVLAGHPCSGALSYEETSMADHKLKVLIEKRNAVNARIKREQTKVKASERKNDTRRKVLAGAAVLQLAQKDSEFSAKLIAELKAFLVRDADRVLFGLPPVSPSKASGQKAQ
jgi:hypothetical protein